MGKLTETIPQKIHGLDDTIVAKGATAVGAMGITYQVVFDALSLVALIINVLLAAGGLYLLWLKIRKARREEKAG